MITLAFPPLGRSNVISSYTAGPTDFALRLEYSLNINLTSSEFNKILKTIFIS